MGATDFLHSPEFNRNSRNMADSGLKALFKGVEWGITFTINFVKLMLSQIFK